MTRVDENTVITQGFIDKLIDKIGKILERQSTLFERDSKKQELIELLLEKVSLLENNFEELTKSLAKGSYPLKLARSIKVTESFIPPKIKAVNISKSQLIASYNEIVALLSCYFIPVTLTPDSYRDLNQNKIFLETTIKGNYWVITTIENKQHKYWLVPNSNIKFNIHKLKTVKTLFEAKGDYSSSTTEFILQEPATLSLLPNGKQWKLLQPGVLVFGNNLKSVLPQSKLSSNEINDKQSKINKQILSTLAALEKKVEQLNTQILQLETQTAISRKAYQENIDNEINNIEYSANIDSQMNTEIDNDLNSSYQSFYLLIRNGQLEVIKVTVPQETMEKMRSGTLSNLQFLNDQKGNYWIINWHNVYCLIPKETININQYQYGNFQRIFECQNYQENYSNFEVIEPAIVVSCDGETWQLERKGKIKFI